MPCALLPPPRTGRADFPHPALLKTLVAGFHTFLLLFGLLTQSRPQRGRSYFRSGTSCVQAVFLAFRLKHVFSKAPSLHRHYPASSLLWASPTPARPDPPLCLPAGRFLLAGLPGSSVVLSTHAVPFHPGEPNDCLLSFLCRPCWFRHLRQVDRSQLCNEADLGSLALRLASLSHEASPGRITPPCARLTTYVTSNSYGELLSVH